MSCEQEAKLIKKTLLACFSLPENWDGKTRIQEMRDKNSAHWRQTEWIGWYFEWRAFEILTRTLGGTKGPTYGKTTFDYKRGCVWDLKTHAGKLDKTYKLKKTWIILNDSSATEACLAEYGGIGFVLALGSALSDDVSRTFRQWHIDFGGGPSSYVKSGADNNRNSRPRKTHFTFSDLYVFYLNTSLVEQGMKAGWIKGFQEGMPNSNAKPRPSKFQIHLGKAPPHLFL